MTGGNTPNVELKTMPGHFLKIQLSKKILDFLLDLKKEYKTNTTNKISNLKLNLLLITWKINSMR